MNSELTNNIISNNIEKNKKNEKINNLKVSSFSSQTLYDKYLEMLNDKFNGIFREIKDIDIQGII